MRPTVNDIAREAGVSLATVDRVLNARAGVSARKVDAVNGAIARLGYVRDIAAANLARGRSYRIAVLLPDAPSQFVATLAEAARDAAGRAAFARTDLVLLRYPPEDAHALAAMLARAGEEGIDGLALMAPETPVVRDAVRALKARGVPVAALVSDLPGTGRDHFAGVDNVAAGRTAARLMGRFTGRPAAPGAARIAVLADSMLARDAVERRLGFDAVMLASFPHLEPLPTFETHGRPETLARVLAEGVGQGGIGGVYLMGSGVRALGAALDAMALTGRVTVIGHELTPAARAALLAGRMDAVITQNPGHLIRSALRVLRAARDRLPIDEGQERIRIEIVIAENLASHGLPAA